MTEGILAQLVEKKDLIILIKLRKRILKAEIKDIPNRLPAKKRQPAILKLLGRIAELNHLKVLINENRIQKEGVVFWRRLGLKRGEKC